MFEFLSQHVDRTVLFFVILFSTATATSLITHYLHDGRPWRPYDDDHDDASQNR